MIIVTHPDKPFEFTGKRTVRRNACIDMYSAEIDELYKLVEETSEVDVPIPPSWDEESALVYVRGVVKKVTKVSTINDDDDIFQYGADRSASPAYIFTLAPCI